MHVPANPIVEKSYCLKPACISRPDLLQLIDIDIRGRIEHIWIFNGIPLNPVT